MPIYQGIARTHDDVLGGAGQPSRAVDGVAVMTSVTSRAGKAGARATATGTSSGTTGKRSKTTG